MRLRITRPRLKKSRVLLAAMALALAVVVARAIWSKPVAGPGPVGEPVAVPEPPTGGDFEARVPVKQNWDVAGPVQLEFDGLNGGLSIETGAPNKLAITAYKSARGTSPEDATTRATNVPLTIRREQDRLVFAATSDGAPGSAPLLRHVDYSIVAPEESGLTVVNGHGTIDASGLHNATNLAGDDLAVRLTNMGPVSVAVKRGGIVVDGAAGQTRLDGGTGDVQAQHLSGASADLNADAGVSVSETEVEGRLIVTSKGTPVSLKRARGHEIDVTTLGGALDLADTTTDGTMKLDTAQGTITAERTQAHPLAATTTTGAVLLTEVQGEVGVTTGGAPVALDDALPSALAIASKGGDVVFSGRLPVGGATSIDTGGGKLRVSIARESAFALDADAGHGNLAVQAELLSGNNLSGSTARTSINGGGPPVVLRTHDGPLSITIR